MLAVREKNKDVLDATGPDYTRLDRADELMLGEVLFQLNDSTTGTNSYSCARCHVPGASFGKPWNPVQETAKGAFGPNLIGIEDRLTETQHFNLIMNGSEFGKQYGSVTLGSGKMPGFGLNANNATTDDVRKFGPQGMLNPEQVWSIVTYERNLSQERPDLAAVNKIEGED